MGVKFQSQEDFEEKVGLRLARRCCAVCRWHEPDYEGEGTCSRANIHVEPDEEEDEAEGRDYHPIAMTYEVCRFFKPYKPPQGGSA